MKRLFIGWLCLLLFAGCASPAAPAPTPTTVVAYPVPQDYPSLPTTSVYPGPSADEGQPTMLTFYIVEPVRSTDSQLKGGGPSQAPIRIVNLSRDGSVIAETAIGTDGQFSVPLHDVAAGDSVAIVFNDQVASSYTREQLQPFSIQTLPSGELVMSSVIVVP
ncbi:hypothetical protein [uncultured Chloroflexus sp.]|uniref:hypothetical protein n=1 Tax=uncultured Chloroflexus sp. TaxID=214040 RepID=UPI0026288879|nr:hypothetical protein [uncultured Chloroflexus sp.]